MLGAPLSGGGGAAEGEDDAGGAGSTAAADSVALVCFGMWVLGGQVYVLRCGYPYPSF